MGSQHDIMHRFVLQEIGRYFSASDGWRVTPEKQGAGYDSIQSVERFRNGKVETVKVLVTFSKEIPHDLLKEMKHPVAADAMHSRPLYAVLAPAHADLSGLPADVRAYEMQAFALDGNELVWLKKPIRKTETPKAAT